MAWICEEFAKIPGTTRATLMDLSLSGFSAGRGFPITFAVQGPDWDKLVTYSEQIKEKMKLAGTWLTSTATKSEHA